jgi:hypothetical protein
VLSVLLRYTDSDYPFGIFKLFSHHQASVRKKLHIPGDVKIYSVTVNPVHYLQVVYYKCVKFYKNPICRLGGVALTRYMDGRTDRAFPIYNKVAVQNLKGEIIQLMLSRKKGGACTL